MIIRWTSPARRDFRAHLDYLAARSPDTALTLGEVIRQAVERLIDADLLGMIDDAGYQAAALDLAEEIGQAEWQAFRAAEAS